MSVATRVSFDRAGMAQCVVEFPSAPDERMRGYAVDLAHDAIVTALMRADGAHPRERSDYDQGLCMSIDTVRDTRVIVRMV